MKPNVIKIILPVFLLVFVIIQTGCAQKLNNQIDYKIKYKGTNKLIDVPRSTNEENAKMCLYDDFEQINQRWRLEKVGNFYRIISVLNQKALSIQFDNESNEWAVVQCSIGGNDDPNKQLWEIKENKNGCSIQSKFNGYKMAASDDFSQPLLKKEEVAMAWKLIPVSDIFSQKQVPVIKANSITVDIKEDNNLMKGAWRIVPEVKPDVHLTSSKKVTFYTDLDSISFKIKPDKIYDFIILLNGKDSACTRIKYQLSRLDMLKKAEKYNYNDMRFIPKFTYQSPDDVNLERIRRDFKLDSIAGEGNEISKIINLMHWVHTVVRHDGSSSNPTPRNTENIIAVCKKENRGVNCRMMATILNECYLAMGIKSRFITCMPKETKFDDCHVINMVYSNDLGKWIWMDPTNDAYVMNEKGELLGIEEVRERLIQDKPLIVNPDANWNRKQSQTKANYLEQYMAKNLYRLETPLHSEYDSETQKEGTTHIYVQLLPLDGIEQEPQKSENGNWVNYKTNNPKFFWTKPE